jgi:hypothetical protein
MIKGEDLRRLNILIPINNFIRTIKSTSWGKELDQKEKFFKLSLKAKVVIRLQKNNHIFQIKIKFFLKV